MIEKGTLITLNLSAEGGTKMTRILQKKSRVSLGRRGKKKKEKKKKKKKKKKKTKHKKKKKNKMWGKKKTKKKNKKKKLTMRQENNSGKKVKSPTFGWAEYLRKREHSWNVNEKGGKCDQGGGKGDWVQHRRGNKRLQ